MVSSDTIPAHDIAGLRIPEGPSRFRILKMILKNYSLNDFLGAMHAQYGDLIRYKHLGFTTYSTQEPSHVEIILEKRVKHFPRYTDSLIPPVYEHMNEEIGHGLLTLEGKVWSQNRKAANPHLYGEFIRHNYDVTQEKVQDMCRILKEQVQESENVEVSQYCFRLTMGVILKLMTSRDLEGLLNPFIQYIKRFNSHLEKHTKGTIHIHNILSLWNRRFLKFRRKIQKMLFEESLEQHMNNGKVYHDIMASLIPLHQSEDGSIIEESLYEQLLTMLAAGSITTAVTLTWLMYEISQHPEVEERLIDEYNRELTSDYISVEDLKRLTYSEMVIKEALRHHPSVWLTPRLVAEEEEIEGFRIEKNGVINIHHYGLHHNPNFWQHPKAFDPEHFNEANSKNRHRLAFLPFGTGMHRCIGMNLAFMELSLALPNLLRQFKWRLAPKAKVAIHVGMVRRLKSLPLILKMRN